jgi:hypothetical protein
LALIRELNDEGCLLSLAEIMYRYNIADLAKFVSTGMKICTDLDTSDTLKQPICDDVFCSHFVHVVDALRILSEQFEADPSLIEALKSLRDDAKGPKFDRRESVVVARFRPILHGIQNNLNSRAFMFVPVERTQYWENYDLFGEDFILAFPKLAVFEMLEVGNCYAAGRNTACVFHCIRVAEFALRKLARKLRASVSDKGKTHPLEYADWDKVITSIRNKITEIRGIPRGAKKQEKLQFYSNLADQCEYMKDIWRNEIMHMRRRYNAAEALAVIGRVRDFVQPFVKTDAKKEVKKRVRQLQRSRGASTITLAQLLKGSLSGGEATEKPKEGD